jgi:hypothetical protein
MYGEWYQVVNVIWEVHYKVVYEDILKHPYHTRTTQVSSLPFKYPML